MNENSRTVMAHAHDNTDREARDAWVFFCFIVVGMIPPMSLFLHAVLTTYGVVLAHLHHNSFLALAILVELICEHCRNYESIYH
jgi:hypothetical protein